MNPHGNACKKVSTCLYIDREVLGTAKEIGLNVSRTCERALESVIRRLNGMEHETDLISPARLEGRDRDLNPGARLHRHGGREELVQGFFDYCTVDLGLSVGTAKEYRRKLRRFFRTVTKPISRVEACDVREFLKPLSMGNANSYGNMLKPLKRFFRDYMQMGHVVGSFRFRKPPLKPVIVPSREELRRFYSKLRAPIAKALFLMYAATGLRKNELLSLSKEDIDWDRRMVVPRAHSGRTKSSWVTFFNGEAERALKEYLATRKDDSPKVFRISPQRFIDIWKYASEESGVRVTPQVLREWLCDEMGRRGVPDRYVDAFCGRAPSSVLARRYSDFSPEKLEKIYRKTSIAILS